LFEALGYDVVGDLFLEHKGIDLLVRCGGSDRLIVELKTLLKHFRVTQVLTYSYNIVCPWICVVGQDELRLYHVLGLLQGQNSPPLFAATVNALAEPVLFEELRGLIGKEAVLAGGHSLRCRAIEMLGLDLQALDSWFEQLKSAARDVLEVTLSTRAMWEQLMTLVPDIEQRLDVFVAGRSDLSRGYPDDPYILQASSPEGRESLDEFGREIEKDTGRRGTRFYRKVTSSGTLVMETVSQ
jgi:hypothetical protein